VTAIKTTKIDDFNLARRIKNILTIKEELKKCRIIVVLQGLMLFLYITIYLLGIIIK
tara:strand:- start:1362 stop:1532 length:171 start_codon:yes stop_codon:yes gene_type:complete